MININKQSLINNINVEIVPVRARGPGGQHVNKTSSAIHLRFDIKASSLPQSVKERLLRLNDKRITKEGIIIIKSQDFRSQSRNKTEAYDRLLEILILGVSKRKKRIMTKPSSASRIKRLQDKKHRGKLKFSRSNLIVGEY